MRTIVNALLLRSGSILLVRRSPHRKAYPNLWSFPGGHVEEGETLQEALVRELKEELGITPLAFTAFGSMDDPNATFGRIVYHLYVTTAWRGDPLIADSEHTEMRWFSLEEAGALPDLALNDYRPLFEALRRFAE